MIKLTGTKDVGLAANVRPDSLDVRGQQPTLFPFDAFEFDNPNKVANPVLSMKSPWILGVGDITSNNYVEGSAGYSFDTDTGDVEINSATIRGDIVSDNYVEDTSGYKLDGDTGSAELNDVTIRGDVISSNYVEDTTGFFLDSSTGDVEFNDGTFRGELDGASGSFSGSLVAATGTFEGLVGESITNYYDSYTERYWLIPIGDQNAFANSYSYYASGIITAGYFYEVLDANTWRKESNLVQAWGSSTISGTDEFDTSAFIPSTSNGVIEEITLDKTTDTSIVYISVKTSIFVDTVRFLKL